MFTTISLEWSLFLLLFGGVYRLLTLVLNWRDGCSLFLLFCFLHFLGLRVRLRNNIVLYSVVARRPLDGNLLLAKQLKFLIYLGQFSFSFFWFFFLLFPLLITIASSYNWTQRDAKSQSEYDSTDTKSGKASRFSLTSSNDATSTTYHGHDDIEKSSGLGSPISTTCTTISCYSPSSSTYPSASQYDVHWSPPPITQ